MSQDSSPPRSLPPRPLSPHLQIWRWHVTMLSSILHRATGIASVAGLLMVAAWLVCLALGHDVYQGYLFFAASPLGLLVWFGLTVAGLVHLTGGIRHLIWDLGLGFTPKTADAIATWTMLLGAVAAIGVWGYLFSCGKVHL